MYDPLTIFYLLQADSCQTTDQHILIETKGEVTRGMTVVDKRRVSDGLEPNATIVTYIEPKDFIERFLLVLSSYDDGVLNESKLHAANISDINKT